jgi:hypothetical protein
MNDLKTGADKQDINNIYNPPQDNFQNANKWIEKLKPSNKNKIMQTKLTEIMNKDENASKIMENIQINKETYSTNIDKNVEGEKFSESNSEVETCSEKWKKYVEQSNFNSSELNICKKIFIINSLAQ